MWSIYFENVIDIAEGVNAKNNLKIDDSAIFKTSFSLDVFLGAVLYVYDCRGLS